MFHDSKDGRTVVHLTLFADRCLWTIRIVKTETKRKSVLLAKYLSCGTEACRVFRMHNAAYGRIGLLDYNNNWHRRCTSSRRRIWPSTVECSRPRSLQVRKRNQPSLEDGEPPGPRGK